jgi:hypothetical protein
MYVLTKIFIKAHTKNNLIECKIVRKKRIHAYAFSFQVCPDFCTILYITAVFPEMCSA